MGVVLGIEYRPGDVRFVHDQAVASPTWTIYHNLNKFPGVTLVDATYATIEGDVMFVSMNRVDVTFAMPVAGKAFLT